MLQPVLIAVLYLLLQYGIYHNQAAEVSYPSVFHWASLAIGAVLLLLFLYARRHKYNLTKVFVPVALLCGLCFIAVTPALRGADEELHFYRCYEISMGHITSDVSENGVGGRVLPASLQQARPLSTLKFNFEQLAEKWDIPLQPQQTRFIEFPTTALYAPLQYLPQSFGILAGRLVGARPIVLVYLGRLANLLAFVLLGYVALKMAKGSPLIFLFLMLPMSLHTASTLSPDAMTNALALLFVVLLVRLRYFEGERLATKGQLALLFALAVGVSLCKVVYLPLCLLVFLLPKQTFSSNRARWGYSIVLVLGCVLANFLWTAYSMQFLNETNPGVDGMAQIQLILTHPLQYTLTLLRTVAHFFNMYVHSAIGANLCLWDVPIYYWVSNGYLFLIVYLLFLHNHLVSPSKWERALVGLVALAVFVLMHTALYVQWTPVGAPLIDGMQGRYLLPLFPLLLFVGTRPKLGSQAQKKTPNALVAVSSLFLLYPVLITLLLKHI